MRGEGRTTVEASVDSAEGARLTHIGVSIRVARRTETHGRALLNEAVGGGTG